MPRNGDTINETSSVQESLSYQSASAKMLKFTVGGTEHPVTLDNCHIICNSQAAAASIAVKLSGDTAYVIEYFLGGQEKVMDVAFIGATGDGSDIGTVVTVRGIE